MDAHAVFAIPFVGSDEDERLARNAVRMLIDRASELCAPPEDYELYGYCCSLVLANELNPHGPFPPDIEQRMPRLLDALRTTFSLPVQIDDGRTLSLEICTRGAVLQIGQASNLAEVVARHRRIVRLAKPGGDGWSEWLCGLCPRSWPNGTEPEECPDCGQLLIRIQLQHHEGAS